MSWMSNMAERFDPVFPEAGGLKQLEQVRMRMFSNTPNTEERVGNTFFHPMEAEHVRKALVGLGDDMEAKSTLMALLSFAQGKNDVAGF